jgi:peptidoglycan/LPS O-acetylase OafA/YrhL
MNSPASRLRTVDALRGAAALGVCWYHFTSVHAGFLTEGRVTAVGEIGSVGVEVFFVISGFVIPYSLWRAAYIFPDFGRYVLRRIVRLDPPYVASLAVVLAVGYASAAIPAYHGPPFAVSVAQIALHLGYLNMFSHRPWLNPVYWTLAVEVQYYIFVGLMFAVLAHRTGLVRGATLAAVAGLGLLSRDERFLLHWLPIFAIGMAAFHFRSGLTRRSEYLASVAVLGTCAAYAFGPGIAWVSVGTSVVIGFVDYDFGGLMQFFGRISYSLYLLHVPIGSRVINLGLRFVEDPFWKWALVAAALLSSVAAAWMLHEFVERPSQEWSSRIKYRRVRSAVPAAPG